MADNLTPAETQALRLGALLLQKNPEIALEAKRLAKKADPSLNIPEVDIDDRIQASAKTNADRIAQLEQQQLERDVAARHQAQRQLSREAGLDPDKVDARVVEMRKAGQVVDHSVVRQIMTLEARTAEPSPGDLPNRGNPPHTPIDMRPEQDVRKLQGNALRRWSADLAHTMVDQFRGVRRSA